MEISYEDALNDILEGKTSEKVYSQEDVAKIYKELETEEKTYVKKELTFNFRIAEKEEKIVTEIDGEKETENTAKEGDYILTGSKKEVYVLSPKKFESRYTVVDGKAKTKPVEILAKEFSGKKIKFKAPWEEDMIIKSSDFLVKNEGEFYRIEKEAFANTYAEKTEEK